MVDSSVGISLIGLKFDGDAGGEVFHTETMFQSIPQLSRTFWNNTVINYPEQRLVLLLVELVYRVASTPPGILHGRPREVPRVAEVQHGVVAG